MMLYRHIERDELWKSALETFFADFLKLFYSKWIDLIDFERPFIFLDKELSKIIPKSESKNRRVDKLVKVFFKNGKDHWFLVHVEIQGQHEEYFPKRMFEYFYRIKDKYNREVTAFALFTYKRKNYPTFYQYEFMGTRLRYEYQNATITNLVKKGLPPNNVFSYFIEVAFSGLNPKNDKKDIATLLDIVRRMTENGISIGDLRFLMRFVNGYIKTKDDDFFNIFEKEVNSLYEISKNVKPMGLEELFRTTLEKRIQTNIALIADYAAQGKSIEEASEDMKMAMKEILKEERYKQISLQIMIEEQKRREEALIQEVKRKEEEAKRKEEALMQEAKRKEEEIKERNRVAIISLYQKQMSIDAITHVLQLDKNYVQEIIDTIEK